MGTASGLSALLVSSGPSGDGACCDQLQRGGQEGPCAYRRLLAPQHSRSAHAATHTAPSYRGLPALVPQRPARLLRATLWAREESLRVPIRGCDLTLVPGHNSRVRHLGSRTSSSRSVHFFRLRRRHTSRSSRASSAASPCNKPWVVAHSHCSRSAFSPCTSRDMCCSGCGGYASCSCWRPGA